ncbi:MAG TPA: hypothetical protein VGB83_13035 [Actinomycetota bacterium]
MTGFARRWPPIVAAVVAAVLVFIVLPNPFRIPQNNPSAQAEYAPTTGPQADAPNANFGETALPQSAGIGAGGQGEGALPGSPPPTLQQFKPRQKNCVGNPPKQTEDPLSPPCVPFFEGDNGGETYPGVTEDEIKVVFYNDNVSVKGDLNEPWDPSDEASGAGSADANGETTNIYRTVKAHVRYFNLRYQTYGRTVHVMGQPSTSNLISTCSQRASDASQTVAEHEPFAVVHFGDNGSCYMEELAEKHAIPTFGLNSDVPRTRYDSFAPYIWGFFPDQESEAAWSASFICRKLYDRPATITPDPALNGETRKFGFIRARDSARGPETDQLATLLTKYVKDECGLKFDDKNHLVEYYNASGRAAGASEAPDIMSRFKREGVTTVICYCVPVPTETTVLTMQNAASGVAYFPEWYWDHDSRMYRSIWNQRYSDAKQYAQNFGVNHHWRNPAFREQIHYQAYLQMEPSSVPNERFNFDIYHLFLNLFQAIQAAGPNLTPETVERGMFTFNYLNRQNPFIPIGGYGPYNSQAISDYTFVDTAMGWWWDPTGTPPGGKRGEGCPRLMRQGLRFYAGEWPLGDSDLYTEDAPCNQDDTEISDPQPGDF